MNRKNGFSVVAGMFLTVILWLALTPAPTWALGPTQYKLAEESSVMEGCFDPCMCPVFMNFTLQGNFVLTSVDQEEEDTIFEVSAIDWNFLQGEETVSVTGSGFYWIDGEQHRLILDLLVGGSDVQFFDSGLVPWLREFPDLYIAVARNGFYCYDQVFHVKAQPEPVGLVTSSWGSLKSLYR